MHTQCEYMYVVLFNYLICPTFRVQLEGGNGEDSELKKRDVKDRSCFEAISSDPDIKGAIGKICAHLETNSRQCQVSGSTFQLNVNFLSRL